MENYRDGCSRLRSVKEEKSMDEKLDYYYLCMRKRNYSEILYVFR